MDPQYELDPAEVQGEPTDVESDELAPVADTDGDQIPDDIDLVDDDVLSQRSSR